MATQKLNQMVSRTDLETQANTLRECYNSGESTSPVIATLAGATIEDAYTIQAINTDFWEKSGRTIVGAKVGLTAKTVQTQLGVDQPDFGHLFSDMSINDGAVIPAGKLLQPKVEAEIAFVLKRSINTGRMTTAELIDSVAYALPALEIVDSRIADWNISIIDTIADNASSGLFVLGSKAAPLADIDLRLAGMVLEKNGVPVSFGAGAACLGNPLHALGWLAQKMAEVGRPLKMGDIILAGALGPMVSVEPGDSIEARIENLGSVRVRFEKE